MIFTNEVLDASLELDIKDLSVAIVFSRFIAIMVMHIYVLDEIQNGMAMMKYAMNHWWKFKYPGYAFMSGFLQCTAMYFIVLLNLLVLLYANNILDIVKDMFALAVISEFDDYFA